MTAPDTETILEYVNAHPRSLVDFFSKAERDRTISQLKKEYSTLVMEHVKKRFDVELNAPGSMTFYRDTTGFFWASNNAATGRSDMVVYDFSLSRYKHLYERVFDSETRLGDEAEYAGCFPQFLYGD